MLAGMLFSISSISQNRLEGIWNRTLLSGVTASEVLLTHSFILIICDVIEIIILKITTIFLIDAPIIGSQWLLGILFLVMYMMGNSIGLLISVLTNNSNIISFAGTFVSFSCAMASGAVWLVKNSS